MTATTIDSAAQTQPHALHDDHASGSKAGLLDPKMLWKSTPDALRKLDPRTLWRNPVMFIVEIGAAWATVLAIINPTWFALVDRGLAMADRAVRATSPRRWPKAAARPRPKRCAEPKPTPWPGG